MGQDDLGTRYISWKMRGDPGSHHTTLATKDIYSATMDPGYAPGPHRPPSGGAEGPNRRGRARERGPEDGFRPRSIFGHTQIHGHTQIFGHTQIHGHPQIYGHTQISPVGGGPAPPTPLPDPLGPPRPCAFQNPSAPLGPPRPISQQRETGDDAGVVGGFGGRSREIDLKTTKSLKLRYGTNRVAHFVWEKCRARTTYIVKHAPRKTFCTL
jgi:hypothetical protein